MSSNEAPVLAVDGPGGSGKGTVSRRVAERLGWHLLDSGALYRLVALAASREDVGEADEEGLARIARDLDVRFESDDRGEERVLLGGEDVSDAIRSEDCGNAASRVAAVGAVREALKQRQRDFRRPPGLVADGRDMGSVIFPDAEAKVFLTASARERARRRHKQLLGKGIDANLERLYSEIVERDRRDSEREIAPLKPAPDARIIDTTGTDVPGVVEAVLSFLEERLARKPACDGQREDD